ncbi:MAG: lipocalin-like domain-containing protein [Acidobacteria bacterium]|nr:lipocalin-like domain-containing protein [Acidobacteriota bacterium]
MKSLVLLCAAVLLCAGLVAQSEKKAMKSKTGIQNPLTGAWKLVSLEEPGADGKVHATDCAGMFVFTPNGKASVQVMYRNQETGSAYAHCGYEASYGSYRIEDSSSFTFHVNGGLVRTLIGKDLKRRYKVVGNRLTVTSTHPSERWKAIWERD